jgi:hypothetical protein
MAIELGNTSYCPKCGKDVPITFREMPKADHQNGEILGTRRFPVLCCEHGGLGDEADERPGHHASLWKGEFDSRFPPAVQKKLLAQLSPADRKKFVDMRQGRLRPDWVLLEEWRKIV